VYQHENHIHIYIYTHTYIYIKNKDIFIGCLELIFFIIEFNHNI
jgi:hypothetical protein